jgi:hypothetical protein
MIDNKVRRSLCAAFRVTAGAWATWFPCYLGFLLLFQASSALAQLGTPKVLPELWQEIRDYGSARVLVQLNVASRPEANLPMGQKVAQREAIAHMQDRIIAELAGTHHRVITMPRFSPALVLNVKREALAILDASPLVRSVTRDTKQAPLR